MYAGAYAYGRTGARTQVVGGRPHQTAGHHKPREQWMVLIRDHHPGYISWEQVEWNQKALAENAHMKSRMGRQRGRGGPSLLVGLIRCRRCGYVLHVNYGNHGIRYVCVSENVNQGFSKCISFGRVKVDAAVSAEILKAIQPMAIDAAVEAAEQSDSGRAIARMPWSWNWSRPATRRAWRLAGMRPSIRKIVW
jgi:Recombinase zinc beta ribbon domain